MPLAPEAIAATGLDADAILRETDALLAEPLTWFPVRHHSHTVARHVETAIRAKKPKIVFIEGPFEANHLIPFLYERDTVPPIAIYSSYRDDANVLGLNGVCSPAVDIPARFAAWYPMTAYSPEYIAIRTAKAIGAEVMFIDLPHSAMLTPTTPTTQPNEEAVLTTSGFYRALAAAAGYKTWNEAWDSLFENPYSTDWQTYRRELAAFCCAVRHTADPTIVASDGTRPRERHFRKVIRETLSARKWTEEQAVVVCGGFHLFLDRNDTEEPPNPPAGTVETTIVPYSFFRISEMAGYGAGNRAPRFYQTCHDLIAERNAEGIVREHVVNVLREVRKGGDVRSAADAIAVTHHAEMLSRLRNRTHPTLDDIHDALFTCCCKGNPAEEGVGIRTALDSADIGTKIGKTTAKLGRLPIVNDFHSQLSDLDLGALLKDEKKLTLKLDKRTPLDARRSALFHRLTSLEIPFAVRTQAGGDFTGTLFREDWQLKWDPSTEPSLIEKNLYGDTIESAALAKLKESLATGTPQAGIAAERLLAATDMDLPGLAQMAEDSCGKAIDVDPQFTSLATALRHLTTLERYADLRGLNVLAVQALSDRAFDRACFALPDAAAAPEVEHPAVVTGLISIAERVQQSDRFDRALFAASAKRAADTSPVPFLRGAFLGLLCEIRILPADALAAEVSGLAQAGREVMITAGDLLDGMLAVSRTSIMLGADALVAAVEELLVVASWDDFLLMLPRLRGAFERLAEAQRDAFARTVAKKHGLAPDDDLRAVSGTLTATARIARLDAAVAAALAPWSF